MFSRRIPAVELLETFTPASFFEDGWCLCTLSCNVDIDTFVARITSERTRPLVQNICRVKEDLVDIERRTLVIIPDFTRELETSVELLQLLRRKDVYIIIKDDIRGNFLDFGYSMNIFPTFIVQWKEVDHCYLIGDERLMDYPNPFVLSETKEQSPVV